MFNFKSISYCNGFFRLYISISIKRAKKMKRKNSLLNFHIKLFSKPNCLYIELLLAAVFLLVGLHLQL